MLGYGPISADPVSALLQTSGGSPPAIDPNSLRGTRTSAPQQSAAREIAGYAVTFGALAALLAGTPQGAGASHLTVGTHGATVANSQSQGFIKGTHPSLFPAGASVVVVGQVKASPEQADSGYTLLFGQQPATASPLIGRTALTSPEQVNSGQADTWGPVPAPLASDVLQKTLIAAPEHVSSGSADTWGPTPQGIDKPPPKTLAAAPEQVDSGQAWWFKYQPVTISGTDAAIARTGIWSPPQTNSGMANVWGLSVAGTQGTDVAIAKTLFSAPQQIDSGYVTKIGELVQPFVAGTDAPIGITRVSAPPQVESGYSLIWRHPPQEQITVFRFFCGYEDSTEQSGGLLFGYTVPAVVVVSVPPPKTLIQAPEQVDTSSARVWGTDVPFIPGTDKPIGVMRFSVEPFYSPVQYGVHFAPNVDLIPPPIAGADVIDWLVRHRRRGGR